MLMMIGPVQFSIAPFSMMDYQHSAEAAYAEKSVIGASPVMEWTGEGPETWSIRARVFPQAFGGMDSLAVLDAARRYGQPQFMMRSDGRLMGWVIIDRVSERSSHLDGNGVGKMIEVDINVRRTPTPAAVSYFSLMAGALGLT
jgi:hypothetical protein